MTGQATAALVRWNDGHVYVGGGSSEVYANMSAVATRKQALAYGAVILSGQGGTLSTETIQGPAYWSPSGSARYPPPVLSDYNGRRVVGFTATGSEGEETMITPALNDPVADAREAVMRRIERASADTVSLWGSPRREPRDPGGGDASSPDTFSAPGLLASLFDDPPEGETPWESPWWRPKANFWGAWVSATLKSPGETASAVQYVKAVEKKDTVEVTVVATCYIGGGKRRGIVAIPPKGMIAAGEAAFMRVTAYGAGAADLTVQVHGAAL